MSDDFKGKEVEVHGEHPQVEEMEMVQEEDQHHLT
jgi:hypothetical protein